MGDSSSLRSVATVVW